MMKKKKTQLLRAPAILFQTGMQGRLLENSNLSNLTISMINVRLKLGLTHTRILTPCKIPQTNQQNLKNSILLVSY